MKPKIGITAPLSSEAYKLGKNYVSAVSMAGGVPFILPCINIEAYFESQTEIINQMLESVDGVLFTGGGDINPKLYGEETRPEVTEIDDERDIFELALCRAAIASNKPMLCICRGMQVLNVCMGGKLLQHVENHQLKNTENDYHEIKISPSAASGERAGTSLYEILGETETTNTRHHQAVIITSQEVVACAFAPDGIIEAIKIPSLGFALGLQWHPEDMLTEYPSHLKLFEAFVRAAAEGK